MRNLQELKMMLDHAQSMAKKYEGSKISYSETYKLWSGLYAKLVNLYNETMLIHIEATLAEPKIQND